MPSFSKAKEISVMQIALVFLLIKVVLSGTEVIFKNRN